MSAPAQPQGSGAGGSSQALLTDTDYENMTIQWNDCEDYEIIRKVGRGKYSEVFEGWRVSSEDKVIIKCLKPVRQRKIKREIKILQVIFSSTLSDPGGLVAHISCLFSGMSVLTVSGSQRLFLNTTMLSGSRKACCGAIRVVCWLSGSGVVGHTTRLIVLCLQNLRGGPNVIQLLDTVRDPGSKTPSLVMPRIQYFYFDVCVTMTMTRASTLCRTGTMTVPVAISEPQTRSLSNAPSPAVPSK